MPDWNPRMRRTVRETSARLLKMRGLTLIELAVTLVVAAILVSLAVPSFSTMMARNRVAAITNEFTAALQLARSEGVKRGKRVTVCKSTNPTAATPACDTGNSDNWTAGWLVFIDGNTAGTYDGSGATADLLLKVGQPTAHANPIVGGSDVGKFVSYLPNGSVAATGDEAARTLTLCLAPEQRRVIVGRMGQMRVEKETCS